jgi:hypothetical protein
MNTFLYALFILAVLILAAILYLATRPKRPTAEFDGGFSHENDLRVTRVRSPYVISKGE